MRSFMCWFYSTPLTSGRCHRARIWWAAMAWTSRRGRARVAPMLVAFSVSPLGAGESVTAAVVDAVRIVRESGLPNHTDAMFTTIEGEWDEVMDVVKRATEAVGKHGNRVSLVLKADIRPGFTGQLDAKLERVEAGLAGA
jgi:uncharacterized protein (TIGR00106 family)